MQSSLTAIEKLALASVFKSKESLPPGIYEINRTVTLQISGTVEKAEPEEYTPTEKIPLLATLALVLEKSGFTREWSKGILIDAMKEAMAFDEKADGPVKDRIKDIAAAMAHVKEVTAALPKDIREGKTFVCCVVNELSDMSTGSSSSSTESTQPQVAPAAQTGAA